MKQLSDTELVHLTKGGSVEAFGELYLRHVCGVRIEASRVLFSKDYEEDVSQEAFLRAYQKIETLGPPYGFGSWVRQIARNIARNMNARSPYFIELDCNSLSITEEHNSKKTGSAMEILARLSPKLRETARLSYLANRSNREISNRLGIPLGTVKSRLSDSRARMQKGAEEMQNCHDKNPSLAIVPKIRIETLKGNSMKVASRGPGLYFGSVLEPGHAEECRFYDYPGGILTQTVKTRVVREVDVLGRNCFEVLIEHSDCEPMEPNVLDYFESRDAGFHWVMRTVADGDYPQNRFMQEGSEMFPREFFSGDHGDYAAEEVELSIGPVNYGRCLAVFWSWENGTPAESFYTKNGRQVLHRRFVGQDGVAPGSADYSELENEHVKNFRGVEYRIWYDTVLSQL